MNAHGSILARVFTSNAMLPVIGAAVAFVRRRSDGTTELLAYRTTNYDGMTVPVDVDTPELDGTTLASSGKQPYTPVSLVVDSPGFDRLIINGAQIFTGTQTVQDMMLLPTPSLPERYSRTETVTIPAQTL